MAKNDLSCLLIYSFPVLFASVAFALSIVSLFVLFFLVRN